MMQSIPYGPLSLILDYTINEEVDALPLRYIYPDLVNRKYDNLIMKENVKLTVPLIKWYVEQGFKPIVKFIDQAACAGDLAFVQWLRANGCAWNSWTMTEAAEQGHLEVVQWLRANGCPWDFLTIALASKVGHLQVVQWLRANGCPWNSLVIGYATEGGHLEVIQWLRANGCPWDSSAIIYATERGDLQIVQWLLINGCPGNPSAIACAAQRGHVEVARWLRDNTIFGIYQQCHEKQAESILNFGEHDPEIQAQLYNQLGKAILNLFRNN